MFNSLSDRLAAVLKKLTGRGVLRPEDVEAALREVRIALLEADVNYRVVKDFIERIRSRAVGAEVTQSLTPDQQVVKIVHEELVLLLGGNSQGLSYSSTGPTILMLVGLQGSGKTTTVVKLALLARREGHRPMVVGLDLRRPAAVEQLRILAEREKIRCHPSPLAGEMARSAGGGAIASTTDLEAIATAAIADASAAGCDVVLLDTAGRLQVDTELMAELQRLRASLPVSEVLLVADSMTGQEAVNVGRAFHDALGVGGMILTKLDGDSRGGAALSLRQATGQQVRFAGTGEKPTDLEVFHADRMASRILGMGDVLSLIEKAERVTDAETVKQVERNMRSGHFTFDDYLVQIHQLRQIGSLESVVEMLPGGGALKGQMVGSEADVRKMEAIILSMTRSERQHPQLIDGSRRRRIAGGSGTQVADVNRVLKAREAMQQLMKQLAGSGRAGKKGLPGLGRMFGSWMN